MSNSCEKSIPLLLPDLIEGTWETVEQASVGKHSHRLVAYNKQIISVMGDTNDNPVNRDLLFLDLNSGESTVVDEVCPKRRHHSTLIIDKTLYVFAGDCLPRTYANDLWAFDLISEKWRFESKAPSEFPKRRYQSMCFLGGTFYFFGGEFEWDSQLNDIWSYNLGKGEWKELAKSCDKPPVRRYHTMNTYKKSMYLFGGRDDKIRMNDLWEYRPKEDKWLKVMVKGNFIPNRRAAHVSCVWKDSLLIHGGNDGTDVFDHRLYEFNFLFSQWKEIKTIDSPIGRYWHGGCILNDSIFVMNGGFSREEEYCVGWHFLQLPKCTQSHEIEYQIYKSVYTKFQDVNIICQF